MFCEKLSFDSLFSSESCVFPVGFLCVLKMYHVKPFIVEKMGFGKALRQCGIHSKPQPLLQKTCLSYASETVCIRKNVPVYVCFSSCMQATIHVHRPRATLVILFPKIDFCSFKRLYFLF